MTLSQWGLPSAVLLTLLNLAQHSAASSVPIAYCASINTATTDANSSIYQSDGLCYDFCNDKSYALAVVQDDDCWCSNYVPDSSDQVSTSECDTQCPGYPSDLCGGDGLFGYMALVASPSGTTGVGTTATSTQQETSTAVSSTTSTRITSTTSSDPGGASLTSATVFVSTVTQGGSVSLQTVTVLPSGGDSSGVSTGHSGLSTGAAVGIAVGILGFIVILGAIGAWLWFRRKKRAQEQAALENPRGSSSGMMSTPRTEMASVWDGDGQSTGRRNSRLMPHDPRMDPYATNIYGRLDNKSHESVNTLRDDQDYSRRVLRTTNPDPSID
ncbi:hypothetical protein BX600DRAFT_428968 [Xylariales sp. PMI_506]|nr:hypothetical protein BX600DRAFT_428968 [Xylariales sp. PMI_506]